MSLIEAVTLDVHKSAKNKIEKKKKLEQQLKKKSQSLFILKYMWKCDDFSDILF